jgi:hypothetical protein
MCPYHARRRFATAGVAPTSAAPRPANEWRREWSRPMRSPPGPPLAHRLLHEETPNSSSSGIRRMPSLVVQPVFGGHVQRPSGRLVADHPQDSASRGCRPYLEDGVRRGLAHLLPLTPLVDADGERRLWAPAAGSSPHSFHTGTPSRFPTRSSRAADIATRAAGFRPMCIASAASIRSSANGVALPRILRTPPQPRQHRRHGIRRLTVERSRGRLAQPLHAIVINNAHPHRAAARAGPLSRDVERVLRPQVQIWKSSFIGRSGLICTESDGRPHGPPLHDYPSAGIRRARRARA